MTNLNGDSGELVEVVAKALQNADLHDGDEGNHYRLFDLLDFSGENKSVMITRQLARAALAASNHAELSERVRVLEALVREAERAWVDTAILLTHPDPETRQSAKDGLYAWRDKARALLTDKGGE